MDSSIRPIGGPGQIAGGASETQVASPLAHPGHDQPKTEAETMVTNAGRLALKVPSRSELSWIAKTWGKRIGVGVGLTVLSPFLLCVAIGMVAKKAATTGVEVSVKVLGKEGAKLLQDAFEVGKVGDRDKAKEGLQNNTLRLKDLSMQLRADKEMRLLALNPNDSTGLQKFISDFKNDPDALRSAISKEPSALRYIDTSHEKYNEFVTIGLEKDLNAINYVPRKKLPTEPNQAWVNKLSEKLKSDSTAFDKRVSELGERLTKRQKWDDSDKLDGIKKQFNYEKQGVYIALATPGNTFSKIADAFRAYQMKQAEVEESLKSIENSNPKRR